MDRESGGASHSSRLLWSRRERTVELRGKKIRVDGYEPTTGTVYQYHGCYWHGCQCNEHEGPGGGSLESTLEMDAAIAENHPMVVVWEHEVPNPPKVEFPHQFHPYPGLSFTILRPG